MRPDGFTTLPESASSMPAKIFSSVVLPEPFTPQRPTRSPSDICQVTLSKSTRSPKDLVREEIWIIRPVELRPLQHGRW